MRNFMAICKKELSSFLFADCVCGHHDFPGDFRLFFQNILSFYIMISFNAMRNPYLVQGLNVTNGIFRPLFGNTSVIMLLMMPLLTMRLLAEEKKRNL